MKNPIFINPTNGFSRTNRKDGWGGGQYHDSRDGGKRLHQGLDIKATPGQLVKSPVDGEITRLARPYANNPLYSGLEIKGTGEFNGLEVKIFYISPTKKSGTVKAGEIIGTAQDLDPKYSGIENHIHMEVKKGGQSVDPKTFYNYCF